MAITNVLLVVEGPHDVEVVARLLKNRGCSRIRREEDVPTPWRRLINPRFPVGGDLLARHQVPLFLGCNGRIIAAIMGAQSTLGVAKAVHDSVRNLDVPLDGVGIVFDADDENPAARHADLLKELCRLGQAGIPVVRFPDRPGTVTIGASPRSGVFVVPDNSTNGTIEALLIEGGKLRYAEQLTHAKRYVETFPRGGLTHEDLKDFLRPAGSQKAIVHAVSAILRPGKAIQVSIQDNGWLEGAALQQPLIQGLARFLDELIG